MTHLRMDPHPLPAGWYRLEATGLHPGLRYVLVAAQAEGAVDELPLGAAGRDGGLRSVILLRSDSRIAGLRDGAGASAPGDIGLAMQRIGRGRALLTMLWATSDHGSLLARVGGVLQGIVAAVALARVAGVRHAGRTVVSAHESGKARMATPRPPQGGNATLVAWPVRLPLDLVPLHDLVAVGTSGEEWDANGNDPAFQLGCRGIALELRAGWYRVRVRLVANQGRVVAPALYPDYGEGHDPAEMIRLPEPDRDGWTASVIVLKQHARSLRFDPSMRGGRLRVEAFELAALGRLSALWRMLAASSATGGPRWRGMVDATVAFVRDAAARGISRATTRLHDRQAARSGQGLDYQEWLARYDVIRKQDVAGYRQRAASLGDGPRFSVLLPVYRTEERWLRRCIDSVLAQAYPNWELCIADDASPDPHVGRILRDYAKRDPRIKVVMREVNGHISEASNSALALASGEFVALLDHDDELRPHALLEMAEAIVAAPGTGLLYSDEDKLDADGMRFQPNFKPDWNYDLLLAQNYVCHLAVIRTDLVRRLGGFRKGFEGSQDHDLVLRCIEHLEPRQIRHVPRLLYHWRAIEGSTALVRDSKDYAAAAGRRAVEDHLRRRGIEATVEVLPHGHYRVRWPLPDPVPHVDIVIPTRDRADLLRTCVESILDRTRYANFGIVVVDNQSGEPDACAYLDDLQGRPGVTVLRYPHEFNYSAINNWAVAHCRGDLVCLLNNDIEVLDGDWLREMASHAVRPGVGAVGAKLYYPDGTIQHAGVVLGIGGVANHPFLHHPPESPGYCGRALVTQNYSAVTGACLMLRRSAYKAVGGLDESLAVAFNDIDLCLRLAAAGHRNVWTPFAVLCHHESASRGREDTPEKRARFAAEVAVMEGRWGAMLQDDPAYNPNLSLADTDFGFAVPPRR